MFGWSAFRRRRVPEDLTPPGDLSPQALAADFTRFCEQAERVEAARQALLSCLPVGRVDPAPVPVGLDLLADELAAVADEMPAWHREEVADAWQACRDAVDESLEAIDDARQVATSTDELEELLDAVADVVEPLAVWGDAERRWRRVRRASP